MTKAKGKKSGLTAVRGGLLYFTDDPFYRPAQDCMRHETDGLLVIRDGVISDLGPAAALLPTLGAEVPVTHYPDRLILPGFIDTHTHYVQMEIMASFGHQLIDWLEDYTFVAEQKFRDRAYADSVAGQFCDELLRNGTTTASVFCATYPQSVEALFVAAEQRNMRMIAGKMMMDRHAPAGLRDSAESSYADSRRLIEKWHGAGRASYCITPRFAPTSSEAQLAVAGVLKREYPTVHVQSHISENRDEIAWVKKLFPAQADYLDVYDHFGLLGDRTILGHGIHLSERECARLSESGTALSHCPTSNLFLGSGLFSLGQMIRPARPVTFGIGTDIGAGTSLSMLQTLGEAYKVSQMAGRPLSAAEGFYLATLGGARALHVADRVGSLSPGHEADFVILNPRATALSAQRVAQAQSLEELLFALMILGDDRTVEATYVGGALWRPAMDGC